MIVGCVKEIKNNEFRVGMTPVNVRNYTGNGHTVYIEKNAGEGSGFLDSEYLEAGAQILEKASDVWAISDMIIKVKEPLESEYKYLKKDLILYTYLHLAAEKPLMDAILQAGTKAVAYETLIDATGGTPLLAPMSQIAGRLSIQEGAKFLEKKYGGKGVLLSGVPGTPRAKVVILGAGSVGLNACKIAVGMGAEVTVIDLNVQRLAYLDDIFGSKINTLISNEATVLDSISKADMVVGAVLIPGKAAPKIVRKEHLKHMTPGSVIVDVAVDQGGCFETTKVTSHDDPVYIIDGIVHYCVGNMPGCVPRTSTIALTNVTEFYGLTIANYGLEEACKIKNAIYSAINCYDGKITHQNLAESFGLEYVDPKSLIK